MKILIRGKQLRLLWNLALLPLLLLPSAWCAQNPRSTLRGTVRDTSGGRIPA
jgi:hypothetical protein